MIIFVQKLFKTLFLLEMAIDRESHEFFTSQFARIFNKLSRGKSSFKWIEEKTTDKWLWIGLFVWNWSIKVFKVMFKTSNWLQSRSSITIINWRTECTSKRLYKTDEETHWLFKVIKESFDLIEVHIIDSFNSYFKDKRINTVINTVVEAFKKVKSGGKQIEVNYIKIVDQKNNRECGYRVIKIVKMLIENEFRIGYLSSFDYADFMNNFVQISVKTL